MTSPLWINEFNCVKFEDLLQALIDNAEKLSGLNVYCIEPYAAGTKISVRAYGANMRSKELVGLEIKKA